MKKRFLSAALALAMVLTLLPLTVFAADEVLTAPVSGTTTVGYYEANKVVVDKAGTMNSTAGWYFDTKDKTTTGNKAIYAEYSSGVIASTGNSGVWYEDINTALSANKNSLKIIGDSSLEANLDNAKGTSLTIDLNGCSVNLSGNPGPTTLTLQSTKKVGGVTVKGTATGSISPSKNFTVNFTDVNENTSALAIRLDNTSGSAKKLTVNLTRSKVGDVTTTKAALELNVKDRVSEAGAVTVNEDLEPALAYNPGTSKIEVAGGKTSNIKLTGGGTITVKDMGTVGEVEIIGGKANGTAAAKWNGKITVTVSGQSKVGDISEGTGNTVACEVSVTGGGNDRAVGAISLTASSQLHKVTVTGGKTDAISQNAGTLTISGDANVGAVILGSANSTGTLTANISGNGTKVAGLTVTSTSKVDPTVNITGGTFSAAVDLGSKYNKKTISGGTFATSIKEKTGWLKAFSYEIQKDNNKFTYTDSFQDTVDAYKNLNDGFPKISTVGSSGDGSAVSFYVDPDNSNLANVTPTVVISTDQNTGIQLPSTVNGRSISNWYVGEKAEPWNPGGVLIVSKSTDVSTNTTSGTVGDIVAVRMDSSDANEGLTVSLGGGTIQVSGALPASASPIQQIKIDVQTADGKWHEVTLGYITYGTGAGQLQFVSCSNDGPVQGVTTSGNTAIQVKGAPTVWALNGSGLVVRSGAVNVAALESATSVATSSVSGLGPNEKSNLENTLKGTEVDFSGSPAIKEAANKIMAGLSASQVNSYLTSGRTAAAKDILGLTSVNATQIAAQSAYDTVEVVVYLNIQATAWTRTGSAHSLSLNMTPYYRIDVKCSGSKPSNGKEAYTVKAGAALPMTGVTGKYGTANVKISLPASFVPGEGLYAHHGDYVYKIENGGFKTLHGFSPFVINSTAPAMELKDANNNTFYFDSLQAAVNAATEGSRITLNPGYTGAKTASVYGKARTFIVDPGVNGSLALSFTGANVTADKTNGNVWTVQLNADTVSAQGNVVVNNVTGGTASATPNPATAGQTVTITLTAQTGYVANGVTVQDANGKAVSVNGAGTTYTFVMPAGSVTVTPTFVVGNNKASFEYNTNANQGTVQAITATEDGKVEQGTAVLVLVSPKSGYRTIGLTARGNNGVSAAVTRTGVNSFNVTVPVGASVVTLTPTFDLDTNTPFTDVLSSHWASKYVTWAYQTKYFEGTGTYTFAPANYITRGEVVAALWKADGKQIVNYPNPFKDVPTNYWAYDAVMWAASKGLIDTSTGYFAPTGYASRAEVVTILYKRANSPAVYGTSGFADVASNATYAKAVTWARQNKLTNGYGGNTYFRPAYAISRAEVAAFLSRAFGGPA